MERLAKRMKLRNISGTIVHHCAILLKIHKRGVMRQGWCVYGTECCEHYWVEEDGKVYDIGYELGCLYSPELAALKPVLHATKPEGVTFVDEKEPIREKNRELYDLWNENPRAFWEEAPHDVRTLQV